MIRKDAIHKLLEHIIIFENLCGYIDLDSMMALLLSCILAALIYRSLMWMRIQETRGFIYKLDAKDARCIIE